MVKDKERPSHMNQIGEKMSQPTSGKLTLKTPLTQEQKDNLLKKMGIFKEPKPIVLSKEEKIAAAQQRKEEQLEKNRLLREERIKRHEDFIIEARAKKKERRQEALKYLATQFPNSFDLQNPKPLKISIHADILAHLSTVEKIETMSKRDLRKATTIYTRQKEYYEAMLNLKKRFDLEGNPVADIDADHLIYAQEQIALMSAAKQEL